MGWSRQLTVDDALEVEMIFVPVAAVNNPDTLNFICNGCKILFDPDGLLANLEVHPAETDRIRYLIVSRSSTQYWNKTMILDEKLTQHIVN